MDFLKGWNKGIINEDNLFIDTEPFVQIFSQNMKYIGENIFDAAKEMFRGDDNLQFE